jgi:hypothetical protein
VPVASNVENEEYDHHRRITQGKRPPTWHVILEQTDIPNECHGDSVSDTNGQGDESEDELWRGIPNVSREKAQTAPGLRLVVINGVTEGVYDDKPRDTKEEATDFVPNVCCDWFGNCGLLRDGVLFGYGCPRSRDGQEKAL